MGRREQKKEELRATILAETTKLLRATSFEATHTREIARCAGISEPTLFKYFPSKQSIVDELALDWLGRATASWSSVDAPSPGSGDPLAALADPFAPLISELEADRSYVSLLLAHSNLWNPGQADRGRHSDQGDPLYEATQGAFGAMSAFFAAGQEAGQIRNDVEASQLAEIAFGVFRTTLQLWATNYWKADHDLSARLTSAFDVLYKGMRLDD